MYRHLTLFTLPRIEAPLAICQEQQTRLKYLALHYGRQIVAQLDLRQESEFKLRHLELNEPERRALRISLAQIEVELRKLDNEYRWEIGKVLSREQHSSLEKFLAA